MSVYESFKYPDVTVEAAREMGMKPEEFDFAVELLGRKPNFIELGVISAMWSEHCSYKTSRKHLSKFPTKAPWVVQGPGENAGVIEVDGEICVCFKVESHNHPSFIEPYQGAATGVGGIMRDVFTMGARPVAAMNSLRFGPIDAPDTHRVMDGVVAGIAGYGNCFGVPTVGGEVFFHERYAKNPLVNAFSLGTVKKSGIFLAKAEGVGNPVIYVGAKTGRDGIHGATMASEEFSADSEKKRPNVQIGDPFKEKLLLEACLELMKTDAIIGIQDMGAAGLTSSSFEMASKSGSGVRLDLDRVPVRETSMTPYEIMLSESQERMLMVAKKGRESEVQAMFEKWDLDAAIIGEVTDDGMVRLCWSGEEVAALPAAPLSDEAPVYDRPYEEAEWQKDNRNLDHDVIPVPDDMNAVLTELLACPTIASKRWVWRQYDHMVRVGTVTLPGDADAAVIRIPESKKGVSISSDCNGRHVFLDPYVGGMAAVVEAARNVACTGARPRAFSNCLNFGNPEKPEIMYQFVKAVEGMSEAARVLETPVVSGNVSFYNETEGVGILPTPTVVMVGVMDDVENRLGSTFTTGGSQILMIGRPTDELGGSEYLATIHGMERGAPPAITLEKEKAIIDLMVSLAAEKLVSAAHDVSDGGLAVALAEMCFGDGDGLGCSVHLADMDIRPDALLFGEGAGRVLIEVPGIHLAKVTRMITEAGLTCADIGTVGGPRITVERGGEKLVDIEVETARAAFENSIAQRMDA